MRDTFFIGVDVLGMVGALSEVRSSGWAGTRQILSTSRSKRGYGIGLGKGCDHVGTHFGYMPVTRTIIHTLTDYAMNSTPD